jgi:hypothetical protein
MEANMLKKKTERYILIAVAVIILVATIIILLNPLRLPEEKIRENMLELTPVGTSMEEVIKVIDSKKKWETDWVDEDYGYGIDAGGEPGEESDTEIGEKSIRVCIGDYKYQIIFPVYVLVYYGFDKDSKLIDVAVRKDMDVL